MATQVQVRDTSIWIKHIVGDDADALKELLEKLLPGQRVRLWIEGQMGEFEKMRPNPHGATPGLKPIGDTRQLWRRFYPQRAGEFIHIAAATTAAGQGTPGAGGPPPPNPMVEWHAASDAERSAAWQAFKALTTAGWRSEASSGDRDELHER